MVNFSYTGFGKWGFTTDHEKGPVVYDPEMMAWEPLCDGEVTKGTGALPWVEQSVWTNDRSLSERYPAERGSVFLY